MRIRFRCLCGSVQRISRFLDTWLPVVVVDVVDLVVSVDATGRACVWYCVIKNHRNSITSSDEVGRFVGGRHAC